MPSKKHTMYQDVKSIDSIYDIEGDERLYQQIVDGFKRVGQSVSWVETRHVNLKGKEIALGNVFYDEGTKTICFLLDYNSEKFYLDPLPKQKILNREIKNANNALSLTQNPTIKLVGLGQGTPGIMFRCNDESGVLLEQLTKQLGPVSEEVYENTEYVTHTPQ